MLPASRVPPPSRRAPNWGSGRGAHLGTPSSSANHTAAASQPTAESRRQPVGCISWGWARPYTRRKDPPTLIPRNQQVSEGAGTRWSTRWPTPLVVSGTGKWEQKKKSGSAPPPHAAHSEKIKYKSRDASIHIICQGATQVSCCVRTRISSTRRLGQWVSLRNILRYFRVR